MSLFNVFKKKKIKKEKIEKSKEIKELPKKDKLETEIKGGSKKKISSGFSQARPSTLHSVVNGQAYKALESPHITEKATELAKENQYVFKVLKGTNKNEIKRAIKSLYKVDVQKVRIINIPPHRIKLGKIEGWKKGYKKAIIKIKEGQKIEVLPR